MTAPSLIDASIARRTEVARDICAFEIEPVGKMQLPSFDAGAHVDVHVDGFVRQYSLIDAPARNPSRYRIAVLRTADSRGGSAAVHARLHEGASLRISAPRNHFPLQLDRPRTVLVAGGIGITPLFGMAATLHASGSSFTLHYCGREKACMAFCDDLQRSPFAEAVRFHVDELGKPTFGCEAALSGQHPESHLYVCGPKSFMDYVLGTARAMGWAEKRLHHESFHATATSSSSGGRAFDMIAVRSGKRITVGAGETALQALVRCQIGIAASCEQGVCGTCLTSVLGGTVDHRDSFLTADEQARHDQFLPCCSRALGDTLTIDL